MTLSKRLYAFLALARDIITVGIIYYGGGSGGGDSGTNVLCPGSYFCRWKRICLAGGFKILTLDLKKVRFP